MEKICKNCKYWDMDMEGGYSDGDYLALVNDPITGKQLSDEQAKALTGRVVRHCLSPKLKFYERPLIDEAAVFDGSQYMGGLITGENFGCVNFEI